MIGVENAYPIAEDLTRIKDFAERVQDICHWHTMVIANFRIQIQVKKTGNIYIMV